MSTGLVGAGAAGTGMPPAPGGMARRLRTSMLLTRLERQYAGHRAHPGRAFPHGGWRRALVVAPHADDEVIGCGGLIQRLVEDGTEVRVLVLTRQGERSLGQAGQTEAMERRILESGAAQQRLGYAQRRQLTFPDRGLSGTGALLTLRDALAREIVDSEADLLAFPSQADLHPDHAAAGRAALLAWRRLVERDLRWAGRTAVAYEVWGPCRADWYLALTGGMVARKRTALGCYASQLEMADYEEVMAFIHQRRASLLGGSWPGGPDGGAWAEGYELLLPRSCR